MKDWQLLTHQYSTSLMHASTMSLRLGFSMAAATLSLSLICLFTSSSMEWVPSETKMSSLNACWRVRSSFTLRQSPINVASEQWGTVGVNSILIQSSSSLPVLFTCFTVIRSSLTTFSSSRVWGCSGSLISRTRSEDMNNMQHWKPGLALEWVGKRPVNDVRKLSSLVDHHLQHFEEESW